MITKFSRAFWETAVAYKGSPKIILRDYDILKEHEAGKSLSQLAIKYGMTRDNVIKTINKYRK